MTKAFKIFWAAFLVCGAVSSARSDSWTTTAPMHSARVDHTATLLPNGKVLVAGGGNPMTSCELYDPASGTWTPTGSMKTGRSTHTATLLLSGKVLVTGGSTGFYNLASAELYDPATGTWTPTGSMHAARNYHTATLLPNGQVLVTGGKDTNGVTGNILTNAELYNPISWTWTFTTDMPEPRNLHTATLLTNGLVLVAGGYGYEYLTNCDLYNPATGFWTPTGPLGLGRDNHTATLLTNGKVLVAGGYGAYALTNAEIYDTASGIWTATGSMNLVRVSHTATLLPNGKVLVVGSGYSTTELYDPASGNWTTNGELNTARSGQTATLLSDGKVLVAGGDDEGTLLASVEIYGPLTAPPLRVGLFGNTVKIWWPNAPGWTLQQNSNLANLAGWSATTGVTAANGTNFLNITPPFGTSFYRLMSQ